MNGTYNDRTPSAAWGFVAGLVLVLCAILVAGHA